MPDNEDIARKTIDANVFMTLATADAGGRPWASPVYFAHDRYRDFYWISSPEAGHSRNLAARPELTIVVFDSQVAPGSGQAVYMAATAEQFPDVDAGLQIYPGPPERGAREIHPEELRPPGPFRLYRARVSQHWILCPRRGGPCPEHGIAHDHRTEVNP
jgi:hypothetical protein